MFTTVFDETINKRQNKKQVIINQYRLLIGCLNGLPLGASMNCLKTIQALAGVAQWIEQRPVN